MIRAADLQDEPAIRHCAESAYAPYIPAIGKKPAPMAADFRGLIETGDVFVSETSAGRLRGFIVFRREGRDMLLENVAVLPSFAGEGVGKGLIAFCEATAAQQNLSKVRLYTNQKMAENLAIYPRLGYVETGRRTEDGFNRVYFEKALA